METLQVLHHLLHVLLGVAVLDVGKPAAAHADDDGHHQHEVLEVVVTSHCKRPQTLLESKDHGDQRAWPAPQWDRRTQGSLTRNCGTGFTEGKVELCQCLRVKPEARQRLFNLENKTTTKKDEIPNLPAPICLAISGTGETADRNPSRMAVISQGSAGN